MVAMAVPIGTIFQLDHAILDPSAATVTSQHSEGSPSVELLAENLEAITLEDDYRHNEERTSSSGTTCLACGIGVDAAPFDSTGQQRAHFKTDWHRYNVKRRLAGLHRITEDNFIALIEHEGELDAVGSLSGSESDTSDEDNANEGRRMEGGTRATSGPQFIFSGCEDELFGVWRCLVAPDKERGVENLPSPEECLAALRQLANAGGRFAIILLRGGHFAAAIYNIVPPVPNEKSGRPLPVRSGGGSASAMAATIDAAIQEVHHKSFHKYVVRAKAGGKQSTKDATGKFARSAGSRLRRHNEAALLQDITRLLLDWTAILSECSAILVAAPGSNGQTLFAGDTPLLNKKDPRVRKVPFISRRPTLSETRRVMRVLLTLYSWPSLRAAAPPSPGAAIGSSSTVQEQDTKKKIGNAATKHQKSAEQRHAVDLNASPLASEVSGVMVASTSETCQFDEQEQEAAKKKAEKRARQKERERERKKAAAAEKAQMVALAASRAAEDEINRAVALAHRHQPKAPAVPAVSASASQKASSEPPLPTRLSARPSATEDAAMRRARMAAAAEAQQVNAMAGPRA